MKRSLELVVLPHFLLDFEEKYFSRYILLIDQISLSNSRCLFRCWAIFVLQLLVIQAVTSEILRLALAFLSSRFPT